MSAESENSSSEADFEDKRYNYRPDGDNWEVYAVMYDGDEDWVATVETERVAEILVEALSKTS